LGSVVCTATSDQSDPLTFVEIKQESFRDRSRFAGEKRIWDIEAGVEEGRAQGQKRAAIHAVCDAINIIAIRYAETKPAQISQHCAHP